MVPGVNRKTLSTFFFSYKVKLSHIIVPLHNLYVSKL